MGDSWCGLQVVASMEDLWKLSLKASEMVQEAYNSFEEHFLWLEEVVAEAHHTLDDEDLVLLPKTPSAVPKRTRRIIKGDAENSPPVPRRSLPNRRGRLCAKVATQKISKQANQTLRKKLRRPSSSITQVLPTTFHCQASPSPPSSPAEEPSKSSAPKCVEAICSTSGSSQGYCQQSVKFVLDPKEPRNDISSLQKDGSFPQEDPSSSKKNGGSKNKESLSPREGNTTSQRDCSSQDHNCLERNSTSSPKKVRSPTKKDSHPLKEVKSQAREISCSPKKVISPAKVVSSQVDSDLREMTKNSIDEEDTVDSSKSTKTTVISQVLPQEEEELHLQLESSFGESAPVDHPETPEEEGEEEEEDMQVVWESAEVQEKTEIVTSKSHPSHNPKITQIKQNKESSPDSFSQLHSPDAPRVTCTKEKAVQDVQAPFVPAPRITRTKQKALEVQDVSPLLCSLPQPPSVPAPRVTRTRQRAVEVHEVQDAPPSSDSLPQPSSAPASRVTRTKQRAIEVQDILPPLCNLPQSSSPSVLEVTSTKQRPVTTQKAPLSPDSLSQLHSPFTQKVTCTKRRTIEGQDATAGVPQAASRLKRSKQKAQEEQQSHISEEISSRDLNIADEGEETGSRGTQANRTHQQQGNDRALKTSGVKDSGVFSLGVKMDGWSSAESVSSGSLCAPLLHSSTPPRRVTRSKMSKLQQAQQNPEKALPSTSNSQHECCSPTRGMVLPCSPHKNSPAARRLAVHLSRDGEVEQVSSEVSRSPVRIVRHSPDKTGKVGQARLLVVSGSTGRITPSLKSKLQSFLTASSSSYGSSASEQRRIIKRTVGTPSESRRPANIVTGITSFIKSQPVRLTKEEMEEQRIQELQRKKDREEDTIRKKEQLLRAKTEERKRRNEERMRRVQEARQEHERLAEVAKEQQERERRQREEEELQRRQRLLAKRRAEEEARKAAKLKEQEEERKKQEEAKKRQKLEEEKRKQKLEEEKQMLEKLEEEKRNYLAQQKIVLEEQRKLKMAEAQRLLNKDEAEKLQLKQTLLAAQEKELQAKRNWEAKTVMSTTYTGKNDVVLNTTYTTTTDNTSAIKNSGGPLNTTYTRPVDDAGASVRVESYDMTPVQPKRGSSSLNYNIDDLQSEDSTDDDASPKKAIPQWAMKTQVRAAVLQQEHYPPPQMENIFPPSSLLVLPDLAQIFPKQKRRFRKRTSSAQWETPPSKVFRATSST